MSLRILLVEDNPLNAELVCDLLDRNGHSVQVVTNAAAFRSHLPVAEAPDVVLMDIRLPDGDGVALLAELRADLRYAAVPVLAVTAQAFPSDIKHFLASGFAGVVTKPIDTRELVGTIQRYASPRRA